MMRLRAIFAPAASLHRWGWCSLLAFLLAGCGREEIRAYRVPKEKPEAMANAMGEAPAKPGVQWKTPPGWKEQPAGGIRVARFSVAGTNSQEADISIIPLPGMSASKKDVVNLWREQIHLGAIKDEDLSSQSEKVEVGSGAGELFDMVSTESLVENKYKARILVAMLPQGGTTWFFKMTGEDSLVREQKAAFVSFLKDITFDPSGPAMAGADPHAFAGLNPGPMAPAPAAAGEAADKPQWDVPPGWQEQPPSQMLLAKFLLTGSTNAKAEVTVSVFPGDTGGLLANVNRWRGQVGLKPVEASELDKQISSVDVTGGKATLVDVSGVSPKSGQSARLIGAIVPKDGRTWFYKMMGDAEVAGQQKAAFLKFVQNVRYPNAG